MPESHDQCVRLDRSAEGTGIYKFSYLLLYTYVYVNALKLTYEHLRTQKNFRGSYPGTPVIRGGEGKWEEDRKRETRGRGGWHG
jgi:hypothetical protein